MSLYAVTEALLGLTSKLEVAICTLQGRQRDLGNVKPRSKLTQLPQGNFPSA
jgi:hypothetical protein